MTKVFEDVKITKETISITAKSLLRDINDPIENYVRAKELEEIAKEMMAECKQSAIEMLMESDDGKTKMNGCFLSTKTVPPSFDFSDNPDWIELNFTIKQLEADRKKIETMMIESYRYGGLSDSEGRKITPARISKEGSITLQVTIPKE